ncbi:MAG: hypothetical protein SNJ64_00150 [Endomicrobiia bacterium]
MEKWIQDLEIKKGALRKRLGLKEGETISLSELYRLKDKLSKQLEKAKGKERQDILKFLRQVNLAITFKESKRG